MTRGFTVVETLLSLLLLSLVLQLGWSLVGRHREAADRVARKAEGLQTVRTVAWLLSEELDGGRGGTDWGEVGADSFALRAFRGLGMILPAGEAQEGVRVCYRGLRAPNPAKDSVLVLDRAGRWSPVALADRWRVGSPCPGSREGTEEIWVLSSSGADAVMGRVFERGSYHIADSAFRYRRGLGGRQPLTPVRIRTGGFEAVGGSDQGLGWTLELLQLPGAGTPAPWRGRGGG